MTATNPLTVFDGHNDTLLRVQPCAGDDGRSFFERGEKGHLDLPRAKEGGFGGGIFAICPSPPPPSKPRGSKGSRPDSSRSKFAPTPLEHNDALRVAMKGAAGLLRLEREGNGALKFVRTADELDECLRDGVLAAVLHFEGAEPIDTDLNALEVFYEAGLRSLGLTWSRSNAFAHGVHFQFGHSPDTGPGLTDAGRELIRACNRLGIAIDLSHLNEKGFWDVAGLSDAPLIASHSCAHALCPATRNLTDKQLDAVGESGGIVGLNFHVSFLRADGEKNKDTPLSRMVEHIDYISERIGVEHVGLGSDFDGADMPQAIGDASGLPNLMEALREGGYNDDALRKIAHANWLRVLRETWG